MIFRTIKLALLIVVLFVWVMIFAIGWETPDPLTVGSLLMRVWEYIYTCLLVTVIGGGFLCLAFIGSIVNLFSGVKR